MKQATTLMKLLKFIDRCRTIYDLLNSLVPYLGDLGLLVSLGKFLVILNPVYLLYFFPLLLVILFWLMNTHIQKTK